MLYRCNLTIGEARRLGVAQPPVKRKRKSCLHHHISRRLVGDLFSHHQNRAKHHRPIRFCFLALLGLLSYAGGRDDVLGKTAAKCS